MSQKRRFGLESGLWRGVCDAWSVGVVGVEGREVGEVVGVFTTSMVGAVDVGEVGLLSLETGTWMTLVSWWWLS